jgi:hypothetical protein
LELLLAAQGIIMVLPAVEEHLEHRQILQVAMEDRTPVAAVAEVPTTTLRIKVALAALEL